MQWGQQLVEPAQQLVEACMKSWSVLQITCSQSWQFLKKKTNKQQTNNSLNGKSNQNATLKELVIASAT